MIASSTIHTAVQLGDGIYHFCLNATFFHDLYQPETNVRALSEPENKNQTLK